MAFVTKFKFWIGAGAIVLLSLILYLVLVQPVSSANRKKRTELEERAKTLEQYASGVKEVKNEQWIERARREKYVVASRVTDVLETVAKRDDELEKPFMDETGEKAITDPGIWRTEYEKRMRDLATQILDSGCELSASAPLVVQDFGEFLPQLTEMTACQQQYWIQKEVADLVAKLNKDQGKVVHVWGSMQFRKTLYRASSRAHKEKYNAIPMMLTVAMEFRDVPLLVQSLLNSSMGFEVEKVHVVREPTEAGLRFRALPRPGEVSRPGVRPGTRPQPGYAPMEPMGPPEDYDPLQHDEMMDPYAYGDPGYGVPTPYAPTAPRRTEMQVTRVTPPPVQPETTEPEAAVPERSETLVGVEIMFYMPDFREPESS